MVLDNFIASIEDNLTIILGKIDANAEGFIFIVDKDLILLGLITDGDVRRLLLNGGTIKDSVKFIMNTSFKSVHYKSSIEEKIRSFDKKLKVLPFLDDSGRLVDFISNATSNFIPIANPFLGEEELSNVIECMNSGWISSQGKFVTTFEQDFSKLHENLFALSTSNGTVAIHLALVALGIGQGDEVLVPNLTFAATINAVIYTGATPVLIDVDLETWNIDPEKCEKEINSKTKAIIPVHLYGEPSDLDKLLVLANKYNLKIVEDCAEALGSYYKSQPVGTYGHAATFSFFGNKTITTGEGGMILFRDKDIYLRAKKLRDHGMSFEKRYWHDVVGFNYRLTNLQAAIGVAQLKKLSYILNKKKEIAKSYNSFFLNSPFFTVQKNSENNINSFWLYSVILNNNSPLTRDELMIELRNNDIETRPVFYILSEMDIYNSFSKSTIVNSKFISDNGLCFPSYVDLSEMDLIKIINLLKTIFDE